MNIHDYLEYKMEKTSGIKDFLKSISGETAQGFIKNRKALEKELKKALDAKELISGSPAPKVGDHERFLADVLTGRRFGLVNVEMPVVRRLRKGLKSLDEGSSPEEVLSKLKKGKGYVHLDYRKITPDTNLKEVLSKALAYHDKVRQAEKSYIGEIGKKLKPLRDERLRRIRLRRQSYKDAKENYSNILKKLKKAGALEEQALKTQKQNRFKAGVGTVGLGGLAFMAGRQ